MAFKKYLQSIIINLLNKTGLIIFCTIFVACKMSNIPLFGDPDVAWHIAAGEYIISHGFIPKYDPWSYSAEGQVWYNISWLWDIFISLIYKLIGLQGLSNFMALCYGLLLAWLYKELNITFKIKNNRAALATIFLSALILIDTTYLRPQLISYFLMILLMKVMERYNNYTKFRVNLYVFMISLLWVNVHGSFILIWVIGGAYWLETIYNKKWVAVRDMLIVALTAFLASLVNPWFIDIYLGVGRTLDTAIKNHISEWKPFVFGASYGSSVALLLTLSIGFFYPKIPLRHKILACFAFFSALSSIRGWQLYAILGAPFIASGLEGIYSIIKPKPDKWLENNGRYLYSIFIILLMAYSLFLPKEINRFNTPLAEINFVIKNYPNKKVYNEYDYGGAIIFYGNGTFKHFIDGRAGTAFPENMIEEYVNLMTDRSSWQSLFAKFPADIAIVDKGRFKLVKTTDFFDGWHLVFEGEFAKVYAKEEPIAKKVELIS